MTTHTPEATTLEVKLNSPTSRMTTVTVPTTTFKYNFTLIHETWPTVFFNAKAPKSHFKLVSTDYQKQNKTILTQPQIMPPTLSWSNSSDGARYLVYVCDERHGCGGLGDRQRTIVSLYVLSRLVNRRFSIIMSSPCDITHFFVPFKVQWLPPPDLDPPTKDNTVYEMTTGTGLKFSSSLKSGDFNEMYPQRVLYLITNIDMFDYFGVNPIYSSVFKQWNGLLTRRGRFHWAWGELMRPTPPVMSELVSILGETFLKKKGVLPVNDGRATKLKSLYDVGNTSLICAHVRVGQNPSNPHDEPFTAVTVEDLPMLHNFMLSKDTKGDAMFYVASDYINVRILSHNFFGKRFLEYGAQIKHIDRQRSGSDACDGFKWTLVDQFILSLCDVLVMSPSGFSLGAYYTSNSTDTTYILGDGKIKPYYE
ncbi:uncharacterized protein LOC131939954 [Physella acuta]|uniref:uncharacterized protein LOC131939954 n=1 Tax=Physella acuta TaxID=109671 RepID=UPI0027DE851F|nr:uncharacterized protein LOC131939954 [Physella acuta]